VGLPWRTDQPVALAATYVTQNKHKRRRYMPSEGFEPSMTAINLQQTHALDSKASWIGHSYLQILITLSSMVVVDSQNKSRLFRIILIKFLLKRLVYLTFIQLLNVYHTCQRDPYLEIRLWYQDTTFEFSLSVVQPPPPKKNLKTVIKLC
jgi:hypothetical protein